MTQWGLCYHRFPGHDCHHDGDGHAPGQSRVGRGFHEVGQRKRQRQRSDPSHSRGSNHYKRYRTTKETNM